MTATRSAAAGRQQEQQQQQSVQHQGMQQQQQQRRHLAVRQQRRHGDQCAAALLADRQPEQLPAGRHRAGRRRPALLGAHVALLAAAALLLLLTGAAATPDATDKKALSEAVLGSVPVWVANRSADVVLSFAKADPHFRHPTPGLVTVRGKPTKVNFHIGYYHGNVAMVRYGARFVLAVRKMQFYKTLRSSLEGYPLSTKKDEEYISWWGSKLAVCSVDSHSLQPVACEHFDPRTWKECEWSRGFEGEGPEDPRLIVWPGKGLYLMFGSKPWAKDPSGVRPEQTACEGPWAFQQWLVQLQPYGAGPDPRDPWQGGPDKIIRLQYWDAGAPPPKDGLVKEKNWNPFIYQGQLLFSQQFDPHVVIMPSANGTCAKLYETPARVFRNLTSKPRGNTQAVLVPAAFSGEPRDFYLGVVHAESGRAYLNYFYKMQAHPPFRIFARSRPMPIINSKHPRNPAWTHVSFPMSLDLLPETHQVMVGYGSGDQIPRVKMMPWDEVAALFPAPPPSAGGALLALPAAGATLHNRA